MSTAVDLSAVARVVGIKTEFRDLRSGNVMFLPQRVAVLAQGRSDSTFSPEKRRVMSATEAGTVYGFGSPAHLAVAQLLPANGDGVGSIPVTVYPLADADNAEAATATITPTGTATESAAYRITVGGIHSAQFVVAPDDTIEDVCTAAADAVSASISMPVTAAATATEITLTAKWAGESGNDLTVTVDSPSVGVDFGVSGMAGGLINPDLAPALAQVGEVWESLIVNTLNASDTAALDALRDFGEGRWGALTRKPMVAFTGYTGADVTGAEAITENRQTDRANALVVAPGSPDLPLAVAARAVARIAPVANNNPARDYGSLQATGVTPGPEGSQWDYPTRDRAVKAGVSTTMIRSGVVTLQDMVTMYRPEGEAFPAYRHVCDIVKLQQIIFNLDLNFANAEWDGAPLIPDDQPTANRDAKKPKTARMEAAAITDNLALAAIISDPEYSKENTLAQISPQNPKRLDLVVPVKLGGNSNIISADLEFGFHFGTAQPVA